MTSQNDKAQLPSNPTLKDVNWYKKQLNWGELPPFYHLVASSLGESEGILTHGFDTAIKRIIDKRNWNLDLLGGTDSNSNGIICENKPRIALYQVFTDRGFELQVFPYAKNIEINHFVKDNKLMEFVVWDPHSMRLILRINQLHKYIQFYFQRGDEADKALIIHAHKLVLRIINFLKQELNIIKINGVSIKQYYNLCENKTSLNQDELMLGQLMMNEQANKE